MTAPILTKIMRTFLTYYSKCCDLQFSHGRRKTLPQQAALLLVLNKTCFWTRISCCCCFALRRTMLHEICQYVYYGQMKNKPCMMSQVLQYQIRTQSNSKMFTKPLVNLVEIKIGVRLYRYKSNVLKSEL